ncbi:MAG TPA: sensor histidine kinase [Phycisphaerae bacterium]|nr:sensor histidine kinase [Phycisphaerae bacterium]
MRRLVMAWAFQSKKARMGEMMPRRDRQREPNRVQQPNLVRVFIICFLAVGTLFFGYEIVERTWLRGAGPEVMHALHIIRGFSAAAIASVLATLILLRQTPGAAADRILSPSKKAWKRRLQSVRLRTKIAIPMVALAVIPTITVGIFVMSRMQESLWQSAIQRVEFDTGSKARVVQQFLQGVQQDLRFLSQVQAIRQLAAAEATATPEQVDLLRLKVQSELLIFSQGKRAYYQVRYLDSAGHEVVRLNVEGGLAAVVHSAELQDKSNRYYVKAALALGSGQIYASPMDLNVEHGRAELPPRAVVRYATLVSGDKGIGRGLLVINIHGDYIMSLLGPPSPGTEAWLVDQRGAYMGYVGESEARRDLFNLGKGRHLSDDYAPEEARAILERSPGGPSAKTGGIFLSSASIAFDQGDPKRHWTLLIGQPQATVEGPIRRLTRFLSVVLIFVVLIAAVLGVLIGDYLARPIMRLQQATRDIAAGDLDKRVHVTTGDEIERLANDFNAMTERLQAAQSRLSGWNVELKREVERQIEMRHRLQSGMARADKLSSIGQITAGVMHEVGNPLAAIKTRIQVAEEAGDLCGECQGLLTEVLAEVDRLAAFLRSFARLARLGGSQAKQEVALAEVAHGVLALVSANLREKGVALRCEIAKDLPKVSGVADQLRQLLMNLILNASDASREGGEIVVTIQRGVLTPSVSGSSNSVILQVVDEGEGIPAEAFDKIWDPFFTTKHEGTGLGLAICRQIVQDHAGTIHIDSEPGKGTVVAVTFPECALQGSTSTQAAQRAALDGPQQEHQP